MKIHQRQWRPENGWNASTDETDREASLALLFGSPSAVDRPGLVEELRAAYPRAHILGCSTAGEIESTQVHDETLCVTACHFAHTEVRAAEVTLSAAGDSFRAGQQLAEALAVPGLVHVLLFSDGLQVNGSELVKGMYSRLPDGVAVTGGLSGDGARFERTLVCTNNGASSGKVAAVGFVGDRLRIGMGSMGGWDPFGPERVVTRSSGNVLYELDGRSALSLYKQYLAEHAAGLPSTGLLFPLTIWAGDSGEAVVRTILSVSEADQSLTFAGDIPQGCHARLMRANMERLIDGAHDAARACHVPLRAEPPELAVLISCVGRKLILKQRAEEEIEAVADVLPGAALTGFYSYGEIAPFTPSARCELHNQTMTITTLSER